MERACDQKDADWLRENMPHGLANHMEAPLAHGKKPHKVTNMQQEVGMATYAIAILRMGDSSSSLMRLGIAC